ncbi:hypothetical protein A0J61_08497 [Choanephora cucurbitarum]|uniref:Large ribosomal subunit protein mL50 n=1 Tax=Choanephora cucurbitarum TaxID=101091 RepID=A0A1C7N2S3_9FUNG|nr:hypothetical protein A0J61_08497 [Choanephora cucurbitarum]
MIPSRRIFALASTRYIHTTRAMMAESDGLFGKINPWAKKEQTPVQPTTTEEETKVTFNVDYEDAEEIISWKRSDVLTDVDAIETTVKSVIQHHLPQATETSLPLDDLNIKFQILKDSMQQTGKEVPNYQLNQLKTTQDILEFFKGSFDQKELTVETFFEEHKDTLPSNLTFAARE